MRMRPLFFIFLILFGISAFSERIRIKPKFTTPPKVTLSRYSSLKDFQSGQMFTYHFNGKAFEVLHGQQVRNRYQIGFSDCDSLLAKNQRFPLTKFVEIGYLTRERAEILRHLQLNAEKAQVNFFETTHEVHKDKIKEVYGVDDPDRPFYYETSPDQNPDHHDLVSASLWTVAAQAFYKPENKIVTANMPWQYEDVRKHLKPEPKCKYAWEWGRAAQDVSDEVQRMCSGAAAMNYIELLAIGGNLDDACVYMHSNGRANTRHYRANLPPGSMWPPDWQDENDALFLVPLKVMLEKFPPSRFSDQVRQLITLSDGRFSEIEALKFLYESRLNRWDELDFSYKGKPQTNPIVWNNGTRSRIVFALRMLEQMKLPKENTIAVMDYLFGKIGWSLNLFDTDKHPDVTDGMRASYYYKSYEAIDISNLDVGLGIADPDYVLSVLFSSYFAELKKIYLSLKINEPHTLPEVIQIARGYLNQHPIQFGISTRSPLLSNVIKSYQPAVAEMVAGFGGEGYIDSPSSKHWYVDQYMHVFTLDQIKSLAEKHENVFLESFSNQYPGAARTRYMLMATDLI